MPYKLIAAILVISPRRIDVSSKPVNASVGHGWMVQADALGAVKACFLWVHEMGVEEDGYWDSSSLAIASNL